MLLMLARQAAARGTKADEVEPWFDLGHGNPLHPGGR